MTPLITFAGVTKQYGADAPLRLARLEIVRSDRLSIAGLDRMAAESVMHLISGASVPDEGQVRVDGTDTRAIATDTDWLMSLDRFGFVTHRAILLGTLSTAANLALPLTVSVDPMDEATRATVERLADEVGLARARLDEACQTLTPEDRLRLHLARALAAGPQFLLLEHPTMELADEAARRAFGETLRAVADRHDVGWLAFSDDAVFSRASGSTRRRLDLTAGTLRREFWWSSGRRT
jgi:predicted ABC-type transport system involved in lysophospholipase L1 biosynthesis ATPase subunit